MKRARVVLIACSVLVVFAAALSAAPAAPAVPTPHAAHAAFLASLASLAAPAPAAPAVSGVGVPAPSPRACPTGFCAAERRECEASCAPCQGVSVCVISICDSTCGCQC